MKIGKYQPHHVMAQFPGRYRMDTAQLEIEDGRGRLIATNGRALAVLPVELHEEDRPGTVPGEALGLQPVEVSDCDECFEECATPIPPMPGEIIVGQQGCKRLVEYAAPDGKFPEWRPVLPATDAKYESEFVISPTLLLQLARALGSESMVRLRVQRDKKAPVRVEVPGDEAVGALMLMIDDSAENQARKGRA